MAQGIKKYRKSELQISSAVPNYYPNGQRVF
jgi:hypothetical protein